MYVSKHPKNVFTDVDLMVRDQIEGGSNLHFKSLFAYNLFIFFL